MDTVNWDAVGAVAELLGSVAVLLTIVYLTAQIRHNTKSARSTSTNQSRQALVDVLSAVTGDSETSKLYARGLENRSSLEKHERIRFDLIIFQMMRVNETIFLEYREGLVSSELWMGQWNGMKSILQTNGARESWNLQKTFLSESCKDWVDSRLDENA